MESGHNDVFNIGNPNEITIKELATTIIQLTNSKSSLINKDLPNDDPKQRIPKYLCLSLSHTFCVCVCL